MCRQKIKSCSRLSLIVSSTRHVSNLQDKGGELEKLQCHMANLVQFKRFRATIPKGICIGTKVLYRRTLATVTEIESNPPRIHRTVEL